MEPPLTLCPAPRARSPRPPGRAGLLESDTSGSPWLLSEAESRPFPVPVPVADVGYSACERVAPAALRTHCLMPLHKYPLRLWDTLKLRDGIFSRLPAHYLKSLQDNTPPTPVHWKPLGVKYKLNEITGQRERVQDVPIKIYYPPESQKGLWGGEGWICGFRYAGNDKLSNRLKKTWKPQLFERELYSEILDKKLTITVTMRTLDLIDAAYGFDFYILKTPKVDLCSKLGMDLKRTLLLRLARRDPSLHPNDPEKREAIYNKYQEFVIPEEEAEWVGLTLEEAVEKQRLLEKKDPTPLFKVYVEELVQQLTAEMKKS